MTIKRFVAPTMRRALDLVRLEMGPDAIILSSQKVKDGIEVITSSEVDIPTRGAHASKEFSQRFDTEVDTPLASDQAWHAQQGVEHAARQYAKPGNALAIASPEASATEAVSAARSSELAREIEAARARMINARDGGASVADSSAPIEPLHVASATASVEPTRLEPRVPAFTDTPFHNDSPLTNVDRQMAGLQEQVRQLTETAQQKQPEESRTQLSMMQSEMADMRMLIEQQMMRSQDSQVHSMFPSPVTEALHGHLSALGLPSEMVKTLAMRATAGKSLSGSWRESLARLSKKIVVSNDDIINNGGIFAFVGSTGVGKTTTIAKLAANYVLKYGMGKVALITTDTYRVGAHDQLKSLGRILNVPVRVVDQERSLASVVMSLKSFPLILIDTAGFRQGDPLLAQQERMLESCPSLKRILVLACNAQVQTLKASAHAFSRNRLTGCILTKLDECGSLGEMIGVLIHHKLPVMYTANGQAIPDDLETASAANLVVKAVALMKGQQLLPKAAVANP